MTSLKTETALQTGTMLRRFSVVPFCFAAVVSLIGVLVLIGWAFEIDFLKRIVPGYVFMNPVTCAAFILSSASLWLLQSSDAGKVRFAQVCAAVVALIGLIKMCAVIGLFDVGIDRMLFTNSLFDSVTGQPNRMAPNTALNFLLFGAALLLLKFKTRGADSFPAQYPAIAVILTSFLAVIGYLYGAKSFYVIVSFNPMAIHTAVSFLLLGVGLLLSRPEQGIAGEIFNRETGGAMARRLLPIVIFIPGILGWLRLYGEGKGFFGAQIGTAMLIVTIITVLGAVILSNARSMNIAASRRKRIEEELSASEALLTNFVTHTPAAVAMFDTEMRYLKVSEQWLTDYNLAGRNIIGKSHYEVMPEISDRWKEIHQRCLAGAVESCKADSFERADGTTDWLEWEIRPWHKADGEIGGVIFFTQVITERKKAETLLKNSEEFNRSIFENSPDCAKVLELDGTLHSMNVNGLCVMEIDDLTPFVGKVWVDFWEGDERKAAKRAVEDARSGKTASFEGFCKTVKGTMKYWDVSVAPIFDAEGKPIRLLSTSRDISERKRTETERQVINEIIEGVNSTSNLDELLELVHESIKKLIYAENCFVALYDKKTELFEMQFFVDKYDDAPPPFKMGKTQAAYVFRHGRSLLTDKKISKRLEQEGEIELIGTPAAAWLGVPLRTPTEVIGVLVVQHYEDEQAYTWRDLELLTSVGDQIALAIERKRAAEAVQNSRDYLDRIINAVADPIFVKNRHFQWTLVNDVMCRIMGREREDLIGKSDYDFLPAAKADVYRAKDERIFATGEESVYEEEFTNAFGERRVTVTRKRLHIDKDGEQFIVGVVRDITADKEFEAVLKAGEARQRQLAEQQSAILDALPAHICLLDTSGRILEVNNEWKQFALGNDYSGVNYGVGSNYVEICENATGECSEGSKQVADVCRAVLSGESSGFEMEYPCHSPNEERWFKLTITPLDKEKAAGAVIMHINITERKRIEEELEEARDAALESVRLKSEFLANMSHEIRTPMNGVIGMTGLLLETNLDEEQRDYAQTVQTSADSLLRIIDDILDFSKIEAGQLHFEKIEFDLRECVESTVELLAERAQSKGIEIASLVFEDVPLQLRGDPGRLRQILTNLVGNAIKFTERGEVTLKVRKQSDSDKYASLCFEVADTGIGIAEDAQRRLFRAFTQADGSTTRKYGGTGLGLAISKQLVEMMNGEIGIKSAPGIGSTFWFTARFEKQPNQTAAIQRAGDVSLDGVQILIVDDNATNRRIFVHQTESWGMKAAEAESGAQALEMLRAAANTAKPFNIAILDLMMPEMDGFELARTIKSEPNISETHLVLLPSYGKRGDGQTARDIGIAAYIQKPVRQSKLYDCLINVISEARANDRGDRQSPRLITQHSLRTANPPPNPKPEAADSKVRILVAEDNIVNRKVALIQLKSLGYAADVVTNGREAADAVRKHKYELVLMDCQMPEMDGFEATSEIRRFEENSRHTTIIAMTAHALEGEREKCLAGGMDDYISKPVKIETLKQTLEKWLAPVDIL